MNTQIQKLAEQADKFAKENKTQTISGPGNNYFELFHEKFAELIVKKCISIVDTEEFGLMTQDRNYRIQTTKKIREHFGVEE